MSRNIQTRIFIWKTFDGAKTSQTISIYALKLLKLWMTFVEYAPIETFMTAFLN